MNWESAAMVGRIVMVLDVVMMLLVLVVGSTVVVHLVISIIMTLTAIASLPSTIWRIVTGMMRSILLNSSWNSTSIIIF